MPSAYGQVTYVNPNATGNNDGSSWTNAFTDLTLALELTEEGEIWIAEGTYKPTEGNDRSSSFTPSSNIKLYGGFSRTGSPSFPDRDPEEYETILSGDIGTIRDTSDNSYTILRASVAFSEPMNTLTIDGFTLSGANSLGSNTNDGAARFSGSKNLSVVISNCTFRNNFSSQDGGAISTSRINLSLDRCIFEFNFAVNEGGAICFSSFDLENRVKLSCSNTVFFNNSTGRSGGAINCRGDVNITNCTFDSNVAGREGGAIDNESRGNNSFYNCLFKENSSGLNAGVFCHFNYGTLKSVNCTFIGNRTSSRGSILYINSPFPEFDLRSNFTNCIFDKNIGNSLIEQLNNVDEVSIYFSLLDECPPATLCGNNNVIGEPPLFVSDNDFQLQDNSPCINTGFNDALPNEIITDLEGSNRIVNDFIDMGAYESQKPTSLIITDAYTSGIVVYPNPTASELKFNTGSAGVFSEILVADLSGRIVERLLTDRSEIILPVGHLPLGLYSIIVKRRGKISVAKFIKN